VASQRRPLFGSPRMATSTPSPSIETKPRRAACGRTGTQRREMTRSSGQGPTLIVIEEIPLWSCPHCGASYFTAQTLHEVERVKTLRQEEGISRRISGIERLTRRATASWPRWDSAESERIHFGRSRCAPSSAAT
jgi:YgiT-type zinc finger domain-containing protein